MSGFITPKIKIHRSGLMDIVFRRHEIESIFRYEGLGEVLAPYHLGTEGLNVWTKTRFLPRPI